MSCSSLNIYPRSPGRLLKKKIKIIIFSFSEVDNLIWCFADLDLRFTVFWPVGFDYRACLWNLLEKCFLKKIFQNFSLKLSRIFNLFVYIILSGTCFMPTNMKIKLAGCCLPPAVLSFPSFPSVNNPLSDDVALYNFYAMLTCFLTEHAFKYCSTVYIL